MPLVPIRLPPGINRNGTPYQTKGRWRDCNFIRWNEGVMQPIGGWRRITDTPLTGRVGGMLSFRDHSDRLHLAIGTSSKCYILEGGTYADVTPAGFITGDDAASAGTGFGAGPYGEETYDTERTGGTAIVNEAASWQFDTWGEQLVACALSDGNLWFWDPGTLSIPADTELQPVPNAPTDCRGVLVTEERHMMALAAGGDPNLIRWSDREDYTTWTPTAVNRAGDLLLQTQGVIQVGYKIQGSILVLSSVDAYSIDYVGTPLYYGSTKVGSNCGIAGPRAGAATVDFVVWMGFDGFYIYTGQVQALSCEVWDWVYRELNTAQLSLVTCAHNSDFNEVWWFFPVNEDTSNSRYVVWNYKDNIWSIGTLGRAHWQEKGVWASTVAAGNDNHLYEHEIDLSESGLVVRAQPYIESSPFELDNGDRVLYVTKMIPDEDSIVTDALQFEFYARPNPKVSPTHYGPFFPDSDGYIDVRFGGRQVVMRATAVEDTDWRIGVLRAETVPGGRR